MAPSPTSSLVSLALSVLLSVQLSVQVYGRASELGGWLILPSASPGSPAGKCGPEISLEIPKCQVAEQREGYELRRYSPGEMWATTVVFNESYNKAVSTGFYRCFYFISGQNDKEEKIEMTAPVLIKPERNGAYGISFFVPSKYNESTVPRPSADYVTIVTPLPSVKAVLGPFGGFPNESVYWSKWETLKNFLKRDGLAFDESSVVFAGYSSPFTFLNRKQELWVDVFP